MNTMMIAVTKDISIIYRTIRTQVLIPLEWFNINIRLKICDMGYAKSKAMIH